MGRIDQARRSAPRKDVTPVSVSTVASLENLAKIAKGGMLTEASTTGFLLIIPREHLVPLDLRRNLSLESLVGTKILVHLTELNLEISGRIARTRLRGKAGFEVGVDYSDEAPEYWRECLVDLLPAPGEIEET
ncbi:MAG: hypothetical protein C5B49_10550 [Bdellovibrio sp.]|nr:MAG: hypothetical protein C5B49_10550 [Bdellovibrio sp.]